MSAVAELAKTPLLDDDAPPWRLWLLHGHAFGQYALLYLVHHCLQDASGMLRTLELLFGADIPAHVSSATYHGTRRMASTIRANAPLKSPHVRCRQFGQAPGPGGQRVWAASHP